MKAKRVGRPVAEHNRGKCHNEHCDDPAKVCGLCSACYHRDRYWAKKNAAQRRKHLKNLRRRQATMEALIAPVLTVHRGGRK